MSEDLKPSDVQRIVSTFNEMITEPAANVSATSEDLVFLQDYLDKGLLGKKITNLLADREQKRHVEEIANALEITRLELEKRGDSEVDKVGHWIQKYQMSQSSSSFEVTEDSGSDSEEDEEKEEVYIPTSKEPRPDYLSLIGDSFLLLEKKPFPLDYAVENERLSYPLGVVYDEMNQVWQISDRDNVKMFRINISEACNSAFIMQVLRIFVFNSVKSGCVNAAMPSTYACSSSMGMSGDQGFGENQSNQLGYNHHHSREQWEGVPPTVQHSEMLEQTTSTTPEIYVIFFSFMNFENFVNKYQLKVLNTTENSFSKRFGNRVYKFTFHSKVPRIPEEFLKESSKLIFAYTNRSSLTQLWKDSVQLRIRLLNQVNRTITNFKTVLIRGFNPANSQMINDMLVDEFCRDVGCRERIYYYPQGTNDALSEVLFGVSEWVVCSIKAVRIVPKCPSPSDQHQNSKPKKRSSFDSVSPPIHRSR